MAAPASKVFPTFTASSQALATWVANTGQVSQALSITAANFVNGVLTLTGTAPTVGLTLFVPSPAALDTQLGTPPIGTEFKFAIDNQPGAYVSLIDNTGGNGTKCSSNLPLWVPGGNRGAMIFRVMKTGTLQYAVDVPNFKSSNAANISFGANTTLTPHQILNGAYGTLSAACTFTAPRGDDMDAVSGYSGGLVPSVCQLERPFCVQNAGAFNCGFSNNTGFTFASNAPGVPKSWQIIPCRTAANSWISIVLYQS